MSSLLAVGGVRGHIKVLDASNASVYALLQGHGGAINEMRFHPTQRRLLLSCSADESSRLWHVGTRECLAMFAGNGGHRDAVVSLDVRLDGSSFATGSIDGTVKVWQLDTAGIRRRIESANEQASDASELLSDNGAAGEDAGTASKSAKAPRARNTPAVVQTPSATYDRVHYEPIRNCLTGSIACVVSVSIGCSPEVLMVGLCSGSHQI